ncbi:uncharacterized protein G6M90_00g048810 [Metarhizium brunneum]|uniref:Uncharacterized protein n=1 Tax=Metarhizium brunneum TaxID=500148 RepID=A0A7D5YRJ2_9HYPO|nr:hypothetical protein G6M90_00g048810 [Metarhizium brunneum]
MAVYFDILDSRLGYRDLHSYEIYSLQEENWRLLTTKRALTAARQPTKTAVESMGASSPSAIIAFAYRQQRCPLYKRRGQHPDLGLFNALIPSTGRGILAVASFVQASGSHSTAEDILSINSASGTRRDLDDKSNVGAPGWRMRLVKLGGGRGRRQLSPPVVLAVLMYRDRVLFEWR